MSAESVLRSGFALLCLCAGARSVEALIYPPP
jgi:hypothetical protein